jgi:arylsulfatase A-like enzyme
MRRRDFFAAGAPVPLILSAQPSPRPNILWITCEDMSPLLGCYGDRYAATPNLDRLAAQGVRYDRAYASAPVCSPARSCLITGVAANTLGSMHLRGMVPKPDAVRCFPEWLRDAG